MLPGVLLAAPGFVASSGRPIAGMIAFMSAAHAELSSLASALDEMTTRILGAAEAYRAAKREDLASELEEVERSLSAAKKRLDRVVRSARP